VAVARVVETGEMERGARSRLGLVDAGLAAWMQGWRLPCAR